MAITTVEAASIIPQIILTEAIEIFRANIVLARLCRRDFSAETKSLGDTISIQKRGIVTAKDKVEGSPIVPDSPTNDKIDITIDRHKYVSWALESHAKAKAMQQGLEYIREAIPALAEKVEADLFNLYPDCSLIAGAAGVNMTEDTVLDARLLLNTAKAPMSNRNLLISPKDESALLKVDRFTSAEKIGQAGAIAEGRLGRLHGFDVYMSTLVPTVAGTTYNLAFNPNAFVLVSRALELPEGGAGVVAAEQVDPVSGMTFRYLKSFDIKEQKMIHSIDILYGVKSVDEDRLAVSILS